MGSLRGEVSEGDVFGTDLGILDICGVVVSDMLIAVVVAGFLVTTVSKPKRLWSRKQWI
jgi:hypothetical protein